METEGSLSCLQQPVISLYPEPNESNPHLHNLFPQDPFWIKSSWAYSRVNWSQVETDVSDYVFPHHHNPDDGDRDSSRNVGFYLQPIGAAVCPKRLYWI
jgi:hypothetical protein